MGIHYRLRAFSNEKKMQIPNYHKAKIWQITAI